MEAGGTRAVAVWHRRAGKDSTAINLTAAKAHDRVGTYWHMLPENTQARKVIWDGIDREGRRIIDQAFPPEIRASTNSQDMKINLLCGSTWQCVGSDNYNSLMGANPVGVVFSEYSIAKPQAWDFIRPILAENGGWALFIFTSRGRNHGYDLFTMARENPSWLAEILTVDDTGIIGPEVIQEERDSGMPDEMINQEYYCSFDAAIVGAYYGDLLQEADRIGRITDVPYDKDLKVHTAWDIGFTDDTSIWFYQWAWGEIRIIDHYASHGQPVGHYSEMVLGKEYVYGDHWLPPDSLQKTLAGGGRSVAKQLRDDGLKNIRIAPRHSVQDGIQSVRSILPICYFDRAKCEAGLNSVRHYRRTWDPERRVFAKQPVHDWSSHDSDAFRVLAQSYKARDKPAEHEPEAMRGIEDATWDEVIKGFDNVPEAERRI